MSADDFNSAAPHPDDMIVMAAQLYRYTAISTMLKEGANPDARIPDHGPLLVFAVKQGNLGFVKSVVAAGAAIDAPDADGRTALIWAARQGMDDMTRFLLDHGADPLRCDETARDALAHAKERVRLLSEEFAMNETMSVGDLESRISRYGRVAGMLNEARREKHKDNVIDSCHAGLDEKVTVGTPLRFKPPGGKP